MVGSLKRLKEEIYVRTTGKFGEGRTELDFLTNAAVVKIFRKMAEDAVKQHHYPKLTDAQEEEIREYYSGCPKFDTIYHRVYYGRVGRVEPSYMPEELYYGYIEPYMVRRQAARYIDNKTYYGRMFDDIKQPETIVMRMGTVWYGSAALAGKVRKSGDGGTRSTDVCIPIATNEVPAFLRAAGSEIVLKIAENSEEGAGVFFLSKEDPVSDFKRVIKDIKNDVVVQRVVNQHPAFTALHPQSVNTLRIMSYLDISQNRRPEVKILATAVRFGVGDSRVDNVTSGGFFLGVDEDGNTLGTGSGNRGRVIYEHPEFGFIIKEHPPYDLRQYMLRRTRDTRII